MRKISENVNETKKSKDDNNNDKKIMSDEEIDNLDLENQKAKKLMEEYEEDTGKYAIWQDKITEGFKKWLKGEKIYDRDKERISLYVSEDTKEKWQNFIKEQNYTTISKLIRESVDYFIDQKTNLISSGIHKMDEKTIANISHDLKEPLTSIKGFSQLLLENYKDDLEEDVLGTIKNIFDQSMLLENKIINILDKIKVQEGQAQYDILLIEDDLATIRLLTSYFESKGFSCKGVISGTKGIEELRTAIPKLILLDIILPDISGYEICEMIKNDKKFKDIPIFFLTAIPGFEVEKNIGKADGYILKPFDFSDFEVVFKHL